jgi:hypothetical protein
MIKYLSHMHAIDYNKTEIDLSIVSWFSGN